MTTLYVDPVNGLDTNDGLTESTALLSFHAAMLLLYGSMYLDPSNKFYNIQVSVYGEHEIRLLAGSHYLTYGYKMTVNGSGFISAHLTVSSAQAANLVYIGADLQSNNFDALFWFDCVSTETPINTSAAYFTIRGINCISTSANIRLIYFRSVYTGSNMLGNGMGGITLANSTFTNFSLLASLSATNSFINWFICYNVATILTTLYTATGTVTSIITDRNAVGSAGIRLINGVVSAAISETVQGNGAFIPAPNNNYSYDPRVVDMRTWISDPTFVLGTAAITQNYISIQSGTACRVLSDVMFYPNGIKFSSNYTACTELTTNISGEKHVVDSTPLDSNRTIEFRASDTQFQQTDVSPAWVTVARGALHNTIEGKYVQARVTLTTTGV